MESLKRSEKGEKKVKNAASWLLWVSSEFVGQKIGRKIHDDDWLTWVLPRGIFKRQEMRNDDTSNRMIAEQWDDATNSRKRVKTVKTGVFFAFGENFKMLNVVIYVLRHFLGDW